MNNAILLNLISNKPSVKHENSLSPEHNGEFETGLNKVLDAQNTPNRSSLEADNISTPFILKDYYEAKANELDSAKNLAELLSLILGLLNPNNTAAIDDSEDKKSLDYTISLGAIDRFSLNATALINALGNPQNPLEIKDIFKQVKSSFDALTLSSSQIEALFNQIDTSKLQNLTEGLFDLNKSNNILTGLMQSTKMKEFTDSLQAEIASSKNLGTNKTFSDMALRTDNLSFTDSANVSPQTNNLRKEVDSPLPQIANVLNTLMNLALKQKMTLNEIKSTNTENSSLGIILDDNQKFENLLLGKESFSESNLLIKHLNEQIELARFGSNTKMEQDTVNHSAILNNNEPHDKNTLIHLTSAETNNRIHQGNLTTQFGTEAWQTALKQQLLFFIKNGIQSAELRLHPQELGVIQIQIALDENLIKLQLFSANTQVRHSMENTINMLKDSFDQQGLELGESFIGFSHSDSQASEQQKATQERLNHLLSPESDAKTDQTELQQNKTLPQTRNTRSAGVDNFI